MLRGYDGPELVLHDPRPRLRPRRPDGGQASVSSVLSREHITPLGVPPAPWSAKFASFFWLIGEGGVIGRLELDNHLGVDHVAEGGDQHQPQQDVEADPQHTGLAQPRRPRAHRQDGHEAEVETLKECPGVKLGEGGGPGGDVGEEQQHGDQQRARHTGGASRWNGENVTKKRKINIRDQEIIGYSLSLLLWSLFRFH